MNQDTAYKLYTEVCLGLLTGNFTSVDLTTKLRCLRQSISCYVCYNFPTDPYSSAVSACQHYVCHSCLTGKLRLPSTGPKTCADCKDRTKFQPDNHIRMLVNAYGALCHYILYAAEFELYQFTNKVENGKKNPLYELVMEGMSILGIEMSENEVFPNSASNSQMVSTTTRRVSTTRSRQNSESSSASSDMRLRVKLPRLREAADGASNVRAKRK